MITVYDDAPEENNEYAEPQTCEGDGIRLYFRAVGEPLGVRVRGMENASVRDSIVLLGGCGGEFAYGEDAHALRLTSKLVELRLGHANPILRFAQKVGSRPHRLRQNEEKTVKNGLFGRSGGTRTHGLQYPKLARYHLRYASKRIKTIEFCCGQLCGQPRILTIFSELVKCEKFSVFKAF